MCQAIREWREDDKAEGRAEGITLGKAQGITMVVQNMLKKGYSDEEICELTECTMELINQLREAAVS